MVAYLHLQAVGVPHIKNLIAVLLDSTSTSYARWRDQIFLVLRRYALDGHVLSDTLPVLVTRRGDAATASPCPGSLGPSPGSPGHRADSGSHRARDVAFPRDSVSR
jgi:hypothetical protein